MSNYHRILWIEDDAEYNLDFLAAPLIIRPQYNLTLGVTIAEAIHLLKSQKYDAVIFDLRLPLGHQSDWMQLNEDLIKSARPARLGLHLLLNLLGCPDPDYSVQSVPVQKISMQQIGIMSVDHSSTIVQELRNIIPKVTPHQQEILKELIVRIADSRFYKRKSVGMSNLSLLDLVETIINQQ